MEEIKTNLLQPQIKPKRKIWPFIFLFFVILIILGITNVTASVLSLSKISYKPGENKPSFFTQLKNLVISPDKTIKGEKDNRINILLLGIGGEGHDGAYLSDTIILLSIQPSTNQIAAVSIPRDLLVDIPGYGYSKINAANAIGEKKEKGNGPILASTVIGKIINQPIQYYIRADFKAFQELVDEVGKINIYVDKSFTDYQFPTEDYKYQTVTFEKGWQEMTGKKALEYSRSRHGNNGEGSDFARSRRQQKVILALKDEVLSAYTIFNPGKINSILNSLSNHIQTNIEPWEMINLMKLAPKLDYENMINKVIDAGPNGSLLETSYNGASVLVTKNDSFDEIQHLISSIFSTTPSAKDIIIPPKPANKNQPKIEVQNGTWILGLAATAKADLESKGYIISTIGNAKTRGLTKTTIYDMTNSRYKDQIEKLKNDLQADLIKQPPQYLISSSTADIIIIIGEDKK